MVVLWRYPQQNGYCMKKLYVNFHCVRAKKYARFESIRTSN